MIDLFRVGHYLDMMHKMYPEICSHIQYNPVGKYSNLSLRYIKGDVVECGFWSIGGDCTEELIVKVSLLFTDFLATLSKRGVRFEPEV